MKRIKRINLMAFGKRLMLFPAISICFCGLSFAVDRYVSLTGTNNSPYLNWPDAATNIQWAVAAANDGDTVWVTNGTYNLTNRITISKAITNRSVNGPTATFINGNWPAYSNGCFALQAQVYFTGFTITNGYATANNGGGLEIAAAGSNSVVSNCVFAGNTCSSSAGGGGGMGLGALNAIVANCTISNNYVYGGRGGGVYMTAGMIVGSLVITNTATNGANGGGGIYMNGGTVSNCIIQANITTNDAGGIYQSAGSVYNSTITQNRGPLTGSTYKYGGGINIGSGLVKDCIISSNKMNYFGGGVFIGGAATIQNCIIIGNSSGAYGAGIGINSSAGLVQNCLIANNVTTDDKGGGVFFNAADAIVRDCTIVSNRAANGGGIWGSATIPHSLENNIVYANIAATASNNYWGAFNATNSCSYPLLDGTGNITNDPQFVDSANNNYRLNMSSPCINTGTNQGWMTGTVDLDGHRRIDRLYGRVDMGAYEFIRKITLISGH